MILFLPKMKIIEQRSIYCFGTRKLTKRTKQNNAKSNAKNEINLFVRFFCFVKLFLWIKTKTVAQKNQHETWLDFLIRMKEQRPKKSLEDLKMVFNRIIVVQRWRKINGRDLQKPRVIHLILWTVELVIFLSVCLLLVFCSTSKLSRVDLIVVSRLRTFDCLIFAYDERTDHMYRNDFYPIRTIKKWEKNKSRLAKRKRFASISTCSYFFPAQLDD